MNVKFPVGATVVNRREPNVLTVIEVIGEDRRCSGTEKDGTPFEHVFPVESLHDVGDCVRIRRTA